MTTQKRRKRCTKLRANQHLPPELWAEIFLRLAVKTLLNFRCVCKNWYNLIDSPDFISMHTTLNNKRHKTHILVMENVSLNNGIYGRFGCKITIRRSDTFRKTSEILETQKSYNLVGSCNGLILVLEKYAALDLKVEKMMMLWNPSIRKCFILPPVPHHPSPTLKYDTYALGFSPSRNDYKVAAFGYDESGDLLTSIAVYSLNHNIWSILAYKPDLPHLIGVRFGYSLFSQGAAHWFVCYRRYIETHVLSFDFDMETFRMVELPYNNSEILGCIFVLDDSLAVFGLSAWKSFIWVMKNDGGEKLWSLWFSGDSTLNVYNSIAFGERVYYDDKSGTIFKVTAKPTNGLMSYNIKTQQLRHLGRSIRHGITYMNTYVESLLLCRAPEGRTLTSFP